MRTHTALRTPRLEARITKQHVYLMTTITLVTCLLAAAPARADILFSTQSVTALPGENDGSFEVLVTNTGNSPVDVADFEFEVTTSDNALTFTESTTQADSALTFSPANRVRMRPKTP